ncbi:MAG: hypothetical protein ACU0CT_11205 [Paracoccaceae bacterium]
MNDPVTNVAIEDVLSSIRRLVSEDARVQPLAWRPDQRENDEAEEAETAAEPMAGRLVLTPALRVTGAEEVAAEPSVAEADPLTLDKPQDPVDEGAQDSAVSDEAAQAAAWVEEIRDAVADAAMSDSAPEIPATEDTEDLGGAPYVLGDTVTEALPWEDHHDDVPQGTDAIESDALRAADDVHLADDVQAVAMPEVDAPQDEARDSGFVFASTRDGMMRGDAAGAADPGQAAAVDDLDDRDLFLREDEALLDEHMLRELVAEIVRQELQGALGERITRNVRKLVRREIHRALTSHELE